MTNDEIIIKLTEFINSKDQIRTRLNYEIYETLNSLLILLLIHSFFVRTCDLNELIFIKQCDHESALFYLILL